MNRRRGVLGPSGEPARRGSLPVGESAGHVDFVIGFAVPPGAPDPIASDLAVTAGHVVLMMRASSFLRISVAQVVSLSRGSVSK